jgi:hypothetical protein
MCCLCGGRQNQQEGTSCCTLTYMQLVTSAFTSLCCYPMHIASISPSGCVSVCGFGCVKTFGLLQWRVGADVAGCCRVCHVLCVSHLLCACACLCGQWLLSSWLLPLGGLVCCVLTQLEGTRVTHHVVDSNTVCLCVSVSSVHCCMFSVLLAAAAPHPWQAAAFRPN